MRVALKWLTKATNAHAQARAVATVTAMHATEDVTIRVATPDDVPLVLAFIRDLAIYEKLEHQVVATEEGLARSLFGDTPAAEVVFAEVAGQAVGFALFFHTFSTFLGQRGLYLEDLFVQDAARGKGVGRALLAHLARLAIERGCGRLEWVVLDWNEPALQFYRGIGAEAMSAWSVQRLTGASLERLADAATG